MELVTVFEAGGVSPKEITIKLTIEAKSKYGHAELARIR